MATASPAPRYRRRTLLLGGLLLSLLAWLGLSAPGQSTLAALWQGLGSAWAGPRTHTHPAPVVDDRGFAVTVLAEGLEHPWGMARLPNGDFLVSERPGRLQRVHATGTDMTAIQGLPRIAAGGQGGLLDLALHPEYADNGWLYFSYVGPGDGGRGTEVARARLDGDRLVELQTLFVLEPKSSSAHHFGSRLVFDDQGYLFISLGDRGERPRAQDLADHAGSIIRLHDDGRIPEDNPYVGVAGARPEIWSHGHRNVQGMVWDGERRRLWAHEHGPQGGDELNLVQRGHNYGWPVITHGVNYGIGTRIGEGTEKPGMTQPRHLWVPSIAPSGLAIYRGERFPDWQGDLLIGALKYQLLARLELDDQGQVLRETRYLSRRLGRLRDVAVGPDGAIYLLTDEDDGRLLRLDGEAD